MTIQKQIQDYLDGIRADCPHPETRIIPVDDWKDVCCLCGATVFAIPFHEIPKDGTIRATKKDRDRMWVRLWGGASYDHVHRYYVTYEEYATDLCEGLQINQRRKVRKQETK